MSIFLAGLLASAQPLPFLDRADMDTWATVEALGERGSRKTSAKAQLVNNVNLISTVCGAASRLSDPVRFLNELSSAYGMSKAEAATLRGTCAVYLSGRLHARKISATR